MNVRVYSLAMLFLLSLFGCSNLSTQGEGNTGADEVPAAVAPMEETPTVRGPSRANSAVAAILLDVNDSIQRGQYNIAAGRLERALRIEPSNPQLWHLLAKVRFNQGRYGQAANLAAKSNVLARGDQELRAKNQQIIDMARRSGQ